MSAGQDDPDQLYGPLNFHHFLTIDEIIEAGAADTEGSTFVLLDLC